MASRCASPPSPHTPATAFVTPCCAPCTGPRPTYGQHGQLQAHQRWLIARTATLPSSRPALPSARRWAGRTRRARCQTWRSTPTTTRGGHRQGGGRAGGAHGGAGAQWERGGQGERGGHAKESVQDHRDQELPPPFGLPRERSGVSNTHTRHASSCYQAHSYRRQGCDSGGWSWPCIFFMRDKCVNCAALDAGRLARAEPEAHKHLGASQTHPHMKATLPRTRRTHRTRAQDRGLALAR